MHKRLWVAPVTSVSPSPPTCPLAPALQPWRLHEGSRPASASGPPPVLSPLSGQLCPQVAACLLPSSFRSVLTCFKCQFLGIDWKTAPPPPYFQPMLMLSRSVVSDSVTPWTVAHQTPLSSSVHGILQAGILEWLSCPPPGDLPDPGIKPESLVSCTGRQVLYHCVTWEALLYLFVAAQLT